MAIPTGELLSLFLFFCFLFFSFFLASGGGRLEGSMVARKEREALTFVLLIRVHNTPDRPRNLWFCDVVETFVMLLGGRIERMGELHANWSLVCLVSLIPIPKTAPTLKQIAHRGVKNSRTSFLQHNAASLRRNLLIDIPPTPHSTPLYPTPVYFRALRQFAVHARALWS